MNALEQMHETLAIAESNWRAWHNTGQENTWYRGKAEMAEKRAAQLAAVSQAEALNRIAAALEGIQRHMDNAEARNEISDSISIYGTSN